ncbi:MAG: hypothetical protein HC900_10230, partial [Methylacidiphilales bacterium]|nr:hypothetical protein [Candidatus Methylacidiphilales bacterium]
MAKDAPDPTLVTALDWLVRLRDDKASDADRRRSSAGSPRTPPMRRRGAPSR